MRIDTQFSPGEAVWIAQLCETEAKVCPTCGSRKCSLVWKARPANVRDFTHGLGGCNVTYGVSYDEDGESVYVSVVDHQVYATEAEAEAEADKINAAKTAGADVSAPTRRKEGR